MLPILTLGEEILNTKAITVPDIDQSVRDLVSSMFESMYEGQGIGLAAPQVGVSQRIFICHAAGDKARVFINPEIIATSPEQETYEEGCLSIPGIYADIVRPEQIQIQAWNEKGRPFTLDADGMLARVIQHEFDHLKGILFLERLPSKKRERLVKLYNRKCAPAAGNPV